MEVKLRHDPKLNRLYVKGDLSESVLKGSDDVKAIANYESMVVFADVVDYISLWESLEVIKKDLAQRIRKDDENDIEEVHKCSECDGEGYIFEEEE